MYFSASAASGGRPKNSYDGVNQHTANSMQNHNYNPFLPAAIPINHDAPAAGYNIDQYINMPQQPPAQHPPQPVPHQPLQQQEDVLVVALEQPVFPGSKPLVRWSDELHGRFIGAVQDLGGPLRATPAAILKKMKVQGLTRNQVKSHLQKLRIKNSYCIRPSSDYASDDETDPNHSQNHVMVAPIDPEQQKNG